MATVSNVGRLSRRYAGPVAALAIALSCTLVLGGCTGSAGPQSADVPAFSAAQPTPPPPAQAGSAQARSPSAGSSQAGSSQAASPEGATSEVAPVIVSNPGGVWGPFTGTTASGDLTISFSSDRSEINGFHVTGLWLCSASGTLSSFTYTVPGALAIQSGGAFTGQGTDSGPDVPGPLSWRVSGTLGADGSVSGLLSLSLNGACGIEPDTPWTATHS